MLAVAPSGAVALAAESADPRRFRHRQKRPRPRPAYHVNAGDTITIDVPEAVAAEPSGEDIALVIVYEDDDIIVIDKPKGLVVHPAAGMKPARWSTR